MIVEEKLVELQTIAEQAGNLILGVYNRQEFDIKIKSDATPLTEADLLSSEFIVSSLKELFPSIPVISEESSLPEYKIRSGWDYLWMVDPLDGTKEFISRNGKFCVNIALIERGCPVFGLIYDVLGKEMVWGGVGIEPGMKLGNETKKLNFPVSVEKNKLKIAVSRFNVTEAEFQYTDYLQSLGYAVELLPFGASYKQIMIAKGEVDILPKFGKCSEWDTAAGHAIVESVGGRVVNMDTGEKLVYNKSGMMNAPFVMFNRRINERILNGDIRFCNFKPKM